MNSSIGFERIRNFKSILILGITGGSVIKTLVDKGRITGIEIDPNIIIIANKYFYLDEIKNLEILVDDAFE